MGDECRDPICSSFILYLSAFICILCGCQTELPKNTTMSKRVLSVGQCAPDHGTISRYLTKNFKCEIAKADDAAEALAQLKSDRFDLVLVNRKLDIDYSDGIEVIRQIKSDPTIADVPVMLVTNYPDHQEAAIAEGAIRGFGKLEYDKPETRERLASVLKGASSAQ
jgi:two-component system chemotaxis response regulator CheY